MNFDDLLVGGGGMGAAAVFIWCARLTLDWWKERRTGTLSTKTASVTDAATANTIILATLTALQSENTRLQRKVEHLEEENEMKDGKITELEARLNAIAVELAQLKSK